MDNTDNKSIVRKDINWVSRQSGWYTYSSTAKIRGTIYFNTDDVVWAYNPDDNKIYECTETKREDGSKIYGVYAIRDRLYLAVSTDYQNNGIEDYIEYGLDSLLVGSENAVEPVVEHQVDSMANIEIGTVTLHNIDGSKVIQIPAVTESGGGLDIYIACPKLKDIIKIGQNLDAGDNVIFNIDVTDIEDDEYNIYIWDSKMRPYTNKITLRVSDILED